MKIYVCEPLDPAVLALLRQRAEVTDDPAQLGTVDAVITRNFAVDRAFFEKCPCLRAVGVHGRGLDGVDLTQARRRGVRVVYAPHENVESVAEHIAALLLALARRIPRADRMARAGAARPGDAALCLSLIHIFLKEEETTRFLPMFALQNVEQAQAWIEAHVRGCLLYTSAAAPGTAAE